MKYLYLLLLYLPLHNFGQTLTGVVRDQQNQPIPAITVTVIGTKSVTFTDDNGSFTIRNLQARSTIRFSGVAVEPLEVEWNGQKELAVTLRSSNNKLDEVQVIAYGTNTQRYNVGSVTKVTADEISKQAVTNPLSALQGRVPGLVVTSTSGLPGSSFTIQVRGQNTLRTGQSTITPKDNPLYIVDGVPFATQNDNVNQFPSVISPGFSGVFNNTYGGLSPFNSINPADIESIEVLRDADATAIYGSRGGNGVILITTKKGKAGKTKFDLNVSSGISVTGHTTPLMNTRQYLDMRREAFKNDGIDPNLTLYDPGYAPDLLAFDTTRYTDWKKVFLGNTAHHTSANAGVSGGSQQTTFHIGGGYNRDTYIFPGDYADNRASLSFSLHHASNDQKFTLDLSSSYSYNKNNASNSTGLLLAYSLDPNYPALTDANGNLNWSYKGVNFNNFTAGDNPLAFLQNRYSIENRLLNSNLILGYKVVDGLTVRSSFGYSTFDSNEYSGNPMNAQNPANNPIASARFGTNNYNTFIIEPQAEYKKFFHKNQLSVLLGSTFQSNHNKKTDASGTGYLSDELIGSVSAASNRTVSDFYNEYRYEAIFGRINYRYADKYIVNLNARRDGSSRFGPGRQFGNFGSAGLAWLFNEENFVREHLQFLSYGKLRATYGITGNDNIGDYQYLSRYSPTSFPYGGTPGFLPQNLYNPDFSWATTKKLEFGLELGFLKDRLLFNGTWYRNRSGNQLINYRLPSQTGFTSVLENSTALVENSGLELTLQASILKGRSFSWTSSFNMTVPKNKLVSFPGLAESSYATTYFIGKPLSTVTGFKYDQVNPETGLFQFLDAKGQPTYYPSFPGSGSLSDFYQIGNLDPEFYGGLQNSFSYRGIQLDIFLEFRKQLGVNYLQQVYSYLPGFEQNLPAALENRWRKPGDQAPFQKVSSQYGEAFDAGSNFYLSSGTYSDASYIRFKTVFLSYNFPSKLISRLHIQNLKLYATAQNLFTITSYKGNDPETQNFYGIPPLKTVACGLQLTL